MVTHATPHLNSRQARWLSILNGFEFDIECIRGKQNVVADALSRWSFNPILAAPTLPDFCHADYTPEDLEWYSDTSQHYQRQGIFYKISTDSADKVCVPSEDTFEMDVLLALHDSPTAGHPGVAKTATRIKQRYYWPNLIDEVSDCVSPCQSCHRVKGFQQEASRTGVTTRNP